MPAKDEGLREPIVQAKHSGLTLDLEGRVHSSRLASYFEAYPDLLSFPVSNLMGVVPSDDIPKVTDLNMARNNLLDDDLPYIATFVAALPSCRVVDLSFNRFCDGDKSLCEILAESHVKFVDIVGNPMASIQRKDFLSQLDEERVPKLIWVPKNWLAGQGWRSVVGEMAPELQRLLVQSHNAYYDLQDRTRRSYQVY